MALGLCRLKAHFTFGSWKTSKDKYSNRESITMFISEIFEANERQVVVVYPGRFQPFHLGHAGVFAQLQARFGQANCYIATTPNVKIDDKNPFNATEKVALMHAAGISNDRIKLVTEPYKIEAVTNTMGFDADRTVLIFAVGAPDRDRLEVDKTYTEFTPTGRPSKIPTGKVVGDPKPMKSLPNDLSQTVTVADGHAYVIVVDEIAVPFEYNGAKHDISHGTECRNMWNTVRNDPRASAAFLTKLYGRATPELKHIFDQIPAPAQVATEPKLPTKTKLQKVKTTKPVDYTDYELSAESIEESTAKLRSKGLATRRDRFKSLRRNESISSFLTRNPKLVYGDHAHHNMLGRVQIEKNMPDGSVIVRSEKDGNQYRVQPMSLKHISRVREETAGVGVVKSGKDPRYMTATMGDQNAVTGKTPMKNLRAFNLAEEDLAWVKERLGEGAVDDLTARHIDYIDQDIDALKTRINTEQLPANYVETLKQKIAKLEQERAKLAFNPR
jgi:hypothetical protein